MKSSSSIFQNFKLKANQQSPTNTVKTANSTQTNESNSTRKMSKLFDAKSSKSATNLLSNNTDNLRPSILPITNKNVLMGHSDIFTDRINKTSYLTDSQMNKIGSIYQIGYLGSAILTKGKTGLGCLQQPLRELYTIYRQQGSRLLQNRRLFVSLDGVTMLFNELGVEKCVHNDLSSVYDIQLLKLVCEQKKDKKIYCAFLPFGEETDPSFTNLFYPLEKHFGREIENLTHPLIIALIMRRSTGIQALECHLLITSLANEARSIVDAINGVCDRYKNNQNKKTNVFQYSPYTSFSNSEKINETKNSLNNAQLKSNEHVHKTSSHSEENQNAQTKWSVISSTPPIPVRSKIKTTLDTSKLLPPKSPMHSNQKITIAPNEHTSVDSRVYNGYTENKSVTSHSNEIKNTTNNIADLKSKSASNIPVKNNSNPSLFSKFKLNKNKSSASSVPKQDLTKVSKSSLKNSTDKKQEQKESKKSTTPSLLSLSTVGFDEAKSNLKNTPKKKILKNSNSSNESDSKEGTNKSIRSTSALGNIIPRDQSGSRNNKENNQRSASQTRSSLANPSLASFISTDDRSSLKDSTREKKLSIGKRLLQSARSSLKSQNSKRNKSASKTLTSNSAVSFSKKDLNKIADIDFRKSRTSFIDDNLLIDGGSSSLIPLFHHYHQRPSLANNPNLRLRSLTPNFNAGTHISLTPGQILIANSNNNQDSNFILRSRSPGGYRLRSLTPSSLRVDRQDNNYVIDNNLQSNSIKFNDYHSSLTSLSTHQNKTKTANYKTVSIAPISKNMMIKVNHFPFKQNRSFTDETDEYETDFGEENEYAHVKYKSHRLKSPLNNPKMFANHLVWNHSSKSVECLDTNYETIKSNLISPSNQKLHPVARVISPGMVESPFKTKDQDFGDLKKKSIVEDTSKFLKRQNIDTTPYYSTYSTQSQTNFEESNLKNTSTRSNSKIEHEIKIQQSPKIETSFSNFLNKEKKSLQLNESTDTSNIQYSFKKLPDCSPASTIGQYSFKATNEPYKNSNSSYEEAEIEKEIKIRSAFTPKKNFIDEKNLVDRNPTNQSIGSVINRLKIQHEEVAEQKKNKIAQGELINHKIVGGVKVFPTLPHQNRQAAIEARQNRLNAIEASIAELENRSMSTELKNSIKQNITLDNEISKLHSQNDYNLSINFEDTSETEHEIIDLTKRTDNFFRQKIHENNSTSSTSSTRNIPIQILTTNNNNSSPIFLKHHQNQSRKLVQLDDLKSEFSKLSEKKLTEEIIDDKNQKVNYIYYYDSDKDNDNFGGY